MLGYIYLEHYDFTDSLYLTIITVATVAYGDLVPITSGRKMQFTPKPDTVILEEDIPIVLDRHKQISALKKEMQG